MGKDKLQPLILGPEPLQSAIKAVADKEGISVKKFWEEAAKLRLLYSSISNNDDMQLFVNNRGELMELTLE